MAAGVNHAEPGLAELKDIAVLHDAIDRVMLAHLGRPERGRAGRFFDGGVAAGVIRMPMRVQDRRQPPAPRVKFT